MIEILSAIWLIIGFSIIGFTAFMQGYDNISEWERGEDMINMIIVAFGWPIIIAIMAGYGVIYGPFILLRKLGEYVRKKTRQ